MAYMQIKLSIYLILSVFKPFYNYPSFATTLYEGMEPLKRAGAIDFTRVRKLKVNILLNYYDEK